MTTLAFTPGTQNRSAELRNALTSLLDQFAQPKWLAAEIGGSSASQL